MELKEYPCVYVEEVSDGKEADQYFEDNGTCCLFQVGCCIPEVRGKDRHNNYCTMVEGLDDDLMYENILHDLMKECKCKGKIVGDKELGRMIRLEGHREVRVKKFLIRRGLTKA